MVVVPNNITTNNITFCFYLTISDRSQQEREMALEDFRCGRAPVLVATAVAARGWLLYFIQALKGEEKKFFSQFRQIFDWNRC